MAKFRRATKPLNKSAIKKANEKVYKQHEGDKRPNPLYDEHGNRKKLDLCEPTHGPLRKEWMDAYVDAGGNVKWEEGNICPTCEPVAECELEPTVDLVVQRDLLTLKHDNESNLEVRVRPEGTAVEQYRIEIRRSSGGAWCTLGDSRTLEPWTAKIAGNFKIRGVARIEGTDHFSSEEAVTVQFPDYDEIVSDGDVQNSTDTEWQNTLNDCTEDPNRRRERGFWIRLNTRTDTYEFTTPTITGSWSGPEDGASVPLPTRPADDPASPSPCDEGATYSVASFHTHTPTTYRRGDSTRAVGPSEADRRIDNADDVPGVVYDYVESPEGSGDIPLGHPKDAAAQRYHSRGTNRRTTPE
jgi:hypothetical protein